MDDESQLDWVMSAGGPLICLEAELVPSWGGIDRLTVLKDGVENDYERAGHRLDYVESLPLREGAALVFGEGPLDTSFWTSDIGILHIVRIYCCDSSMTDRDFEQILRSLNSKIFESSETRLQFDIGTADLMMFDSAISGANLDEKVVSASLAPGRYEIVTQPYDPDPTCSLLLHRFDVAAST